MSALRMGVSACVAMVLLPVLAVAESVAPVQPPSTYRGLSLPSFKEPRFVRFENGKRAVTASYVDRNRVVRLTVGLQWVEEADAGHPQGVMGAEPKDPWSAGFIQDKEHQARVLLWCDWQYFPGVTWDELLKDAPWRRAHRMLKDISLRWPAEGLAESNRVLGRIRAVRGTVWLAQADSPQRVEARPGYPVLDMDEIRTEGGSAAEVDMGIAFRLSSEQSRRRVQHDLSRSPDEFFSSGEGERIATLRVGENSLVRTQSDEPAIVGLWEGWMEVTAFAPWAEPNALVAVSHGTVAIFRDATVLARATEGLSLVTWYLTRGSLLPTASARVAARVTPVRLVPGTQVSGSKGRLAESLAVEPQVVERASSAMRIFTLTGAPERVARLSGGGGRVVGVRGDAATYQLEIGEWLTLGQTIETGADGWAQVDVSTPDGLFTSGKSDVFHLGPSSSLRLYRYGDRSVVGYGERFVAGLVDGAVRWWTGGPPGPKVIEVGDVVVEVKGTDFVAQYDREARRGALYLKEGALAVQPRGGGATMDLRAGQFAAIEPSGLGPPADMAPGEYERVSGGTRGQAVAFSMLAGPSSPPGTTGPSALPTADAPTVFPGSPTPSGPRRMPQFFEPPPVSPGPATPYSQQTPPGAQWQRCDWDPLFALDVPADWSRLHGDAVRFIVVAPGSEESRATCAVVGVREVGPEANLEQELENSLRLTREQRQDVEIERQKGFLAGVPAEQCVLRMTLPEGRRVAMVSRILIAHGRRYNIYAQCDAQEFDAKRGMLEAIVSSFSLKVPAGEGR